MFHIPQRKNNAKYRLFCFPYAGGSSIIYKSWLDILPEDIELVLVQLPGRDSKFMLPAYKSITEMVVELTKTIQPLLNVKSIFFGHSMGAKVAYELILSMYKQSMPLPRHFIASACRAPSVKHNKNIIHDLPRAAFVDALREKGGTPEVILENRELLDLLIPTLRADFKIAETYINSIKLKIPTQVNVLYGSKDDIDPEELVPWFDHFSGDGFFESIDGEHFFIHHKQHKIIELIQKCVV